jgi:hypothetical protein
MGSDAHSSLTDDLFRCSNEFRRHLSCDTVSFFVGDFCFIHYIRWSSFQQSADILDLSLSAISCCVNVRCLAFELDFPDNIKMDLREIR